MTKETKLNSSELLLKLNKIVEEQEIKLAKNDSAKLEKISKRTEQYEAMVKANGLTLDTAPGAQLASKICTDDAFYDMTCANDYLLSVLFADGYKGNNLTQSYIVKAFTKKAKLWFVKKWCPLPSVAKDAKKINIKQFQIGWMCEIDFEMFIGGTTRSNAIKNIISIIFDEAVSNTFEDILINGDIVNTTANINGLAAPETGDLQSNFLAADWLKKHALKWYWSVDNNDQSVWTPYTVADLLNTTVDFNSSFSLNQLQQLANKLWCCGNELLIMDCTTYWALLMLAQSLGGTSIVDVNAAEYKQAWNLKSLLWYTIYISNNVDMAQATGSVSTTAIDNNRHVILAVNPKSILRWFGTDIVNWIDNNLGCETLFTRASMWFGICTNPEKPNVVAGINIKI